MKAHFFDQLDLLAATYHRVGAEDRAALDAVVDHVTAILYELLHPEEIEGCDDRLAVAPPSPSGRVLH
jgi:hypothetical protein